MVIVKNAEGKYTKLDVTATNGDKHSFTTDIDFTEGYEIVVAVKGDATGDGVVDNLDVLRMKQLANKVGEAATAIQRISCDIVGTDEALDNFDVLRMKQVANNVGDPLVW